MKPRIYDCFCYFNEDMLLRLRLETLWEHVDHFVIVESVKTISGLPKPLNFRPELFAEYAEKIRYVVLREYPFPTDDPWRNERYQRDYIAQGIQDARDGDWIIVSDLDEIPRPEAIRAFDPSRWLRGDLIQHAYAYFLNNQCHEDGAPVHWAGPKIVTARTYRTFFGGAERVRNYKSSGPLRALKRAWFRRFQRQEIADGGWHFTWMAGIERIIQKLESFAHQEYNRPEYKDRTVILEKIRSGQDFLNPRGRCIARPLDASFPLPLVEHPERYADWLLPCESGKGASL